MDSSIDESSLLRLHPDEILDLDNQDSIILNSTLTNPKTSIEIPTKAYIDSLHEINERSRRDLGLSFYNEEVDLVKNNQDNNLNDKKLTNLDSISVNRDPTSDNELASKKYFDDQLDANTLVRLNDNSNNRYLQVRVNDIPYNLQIYNKAQIIDTTKIIYPNTGHDFLPNWKIVCNNKYNEGKPSDFTKSTKTNSPTGSSGATVLPPVGNSFMYIECSGNNYNTANNNVFVSFERTDINHISNITFYYIRFTYTDINSIKRSMGKFEIQLLRNGVGETGYTIEKSSNLTETETERVLLNLDIISQPNYDIKLLYSQISSAHNDMCFSDISITHTIF